jgi:hypothetical protein
MNGEEPCFRWDNHGITAYNFETTNSGTLYNLNTNRGVRFDKFGIYGYNDVDGATWYPKDVKDVIDHSNFA